MGRQAHARASYESPRWEGPGKGTRDICGRDSKSVTIIMYERHSVAPLRGKTIGEHNLCKTALGPCEHSLSTSPGYGM